MNKYNLLDLLSKTIDIEDPNGSKKYSFTGIQIPMIQRDYAQGREDESEIRTRFLNAIFLALNKTEKLELDFVYGSIRSIDDNDFFIPLDGQQRLTTLFLLYWYIGNREVEADQLMDLCKVLKRFSYSTRSTARTFCEKLSNISVSFKEKPSKEIINASWFFSSLKKDPTVKGMLVMLDSIHEFYGNERKHYFENLNDLTFYILPLDGFELSDELYIKMNARGKQLTGFENFKADLINWMKDDKNPLKVDFYKDVLLHGRTLPHYLSIASKLDNEWTNIFWNLLLKLEKESNENNKIEMIIDPFFMRFMSRFILNNYIVKSNTSATEIELSRIFKEFYIYGENDKIKYNSFELYATVLKDGSIFKFEKILDSISTHLGTIAEIIKPCWNKKTTWTLFDERITQQQRILFCCICLYLEKNEFDPVYFSNWIRVVWNIAIDPDIRSIGAMITTMKLINDLSEGSKDIHAFFETPLFDKILDSTQGSVFKTQLEEERIKAKLITNLSWEEFIIKGESHSLFQGNIGFLINDLPDLDLFKKRINNALILFDSNGASKAFLNDHSLLRYLICKFSDWKQIENFVYSDSDTNWRLILRRSNQYKNNDIIRELCSLDSIDLIKEHIIKSLPVESSVRWHNNTPLWAKKAHENLYSDAEFFNWIQSSGAYKIKWLNDHFYIVRPSAWYDKVMLDCYRNELIHVIVEEFRLHPDPDKQLCGSSKFFKQETVIFIKHIDDRLFSIIFNAFKLFKIEEKIEDEWINIITDDYTTIVKNDDVLSFMKKLKDEITSNNDKSLIKLFQ